MASKTDASVADDLAKANRDRDAWTSFSTAMFFKAMKHLQKYPKDKVDAWNDTRFDLDFWFRRAEDEWEELIELANLETGRYSEEMVRLDAIQMEALDLANMAFFIYKKAESAKAPKDDSTEGTK